jgi:Fe-S cluster biogenesis protein NfuA
MPSTPDEIERVVRAVLAPLVKADEGELYVVTLQEDAVELHLAGRFSGCPGNTIAKRRIIEPAILAVAPSAQIVVTAGVIVPKNAERVV